MYRSREWSHCPRDAAQLEAFEGDPWLEQVLEGRYRLLELIGEGAMGRVYAATHTRIGRRFAVKILYGDLAVQDNMRARFSREAEAASRLEHPNVVSVVDFGETEGGQLFLVMEFLEGLTLERIVAKHGPLPEARVVRLGRDVARGLRHAHERGLVHRDMKPENVVVVADRDAEVPKIVDFGVAFVAEEPDARVTKAGMVVGTPAYMSPEQALGEPVDHRTDLYGFGMLLYFLLAGRGPFRGAAGEILRQVVTQNVPPIVDVEPAAKVGPELEAIVMRLLSKHPQDRFQDAGEVVAALEELRVDIGPTRRIPLNPAERDTLVTPTAPPEPTEEVERVAPPRRGFSPGWAAAAAGLLVLALALTVLLVQRARHAGPVTLGGPVGVKVEALEEEPPEPPPPASPTAPAREVARPAAAPSPRPRSAVAPARPAPPPPKPVAPPPEAAPARPAATPPPNAPKAPAPAADPAVPTPGELTKRYAALGVRIEALARARGAEAAGGLRDRYLRLPLSAALRNAALREDVARAIRALDQEVSEALEP